MKLRSTVPLTAGIQETKMRQNFPSSFARSGLWVLSLAVVGSCFQPVDPTASSGRQAAIDNMRPENFTPMTTIEMEDPAIRLVTEEDPDAGVLPSAVTTDPCAKTEHDKTEILTAYCGQCHDAARTQAPSGVPTFSFVLNDDLLISTTVPREGQLSPQPFVMPGSPSESLLYVRVSNRTMPPADKQLGVASIPAPTASDIAVLAEWIAHCAPGAPPRGKSTPPPAGTGGSGPASTGGASGTGGTSGTGGATGTGGRPGTGGSASTGGMGTGMDAGAAGGSAAPDAGMSASDAGTSACANGVANNAVCTAQPPCMLANQTCNCMAGGGGARRWVCR